ncbi:MAG: dihydrodipicolinate synthase family protein [Anaerolineae bacterium]
MIEGIFAASITPYDSSGGPDMEQLARHLAHLARMGCHGALLCGTTGEGPSLDVAERTAIFHAAGRANRHGLILLAGTGAVSLSDAINLTRAAYDAGMAGTVILPPFFFRDAPEQGLFDFYAMLIRRAVPADGRVLLYNNPSVSGVPLSVELVRRLRDAFPQQVGGIKDSTGDLAVAQAFCRDLEGFAVLVGSDRLLSSALAAGCAGAITAMANRLGDRLHAVYAAHQAGSPTTALQEGLEMAIAPFNGLPRIAALKYALRRQGVIENDAVRPPLLPLSSSQRALLDSRLDAADRQP